MKSVNRSGGIDTAPVKYDPYVHRRFSWDGYIDYAVLQKILRFVTTRPVCRLPYAAIEKAVFEEFSINIKIHQL